MPKLQPAPAIPTPRLMGTPRLILSAILFFVSILANAQNNDLIVPQNIRFQFDSVTKMRLITSVNGFLNQRNKPDTENAFIAPGHLSEMAALLDEMKDMEKSRAYKDDKFFKCYLTNAVRYNDSDFLVQFSYAGVKDSTPVIRASFTLLARNGGDRFYFYTPLALRSGAWATQQIGNVLFHYKTDLDNTKARAFQKLVSSYDAKLSAADQTFDYYFCTNFQEVQTLVGIDYKADYNGSSSNTLTAFYNNRSVYICGTANEDHFNKVDYHDLWHDRLHSFISVEKINRPVDEGCAYLFGGSWGLSWQEILTRFKLYAAATPNADWLALYNASYNFETLSRFPLNVDYVINALLVGKIEKEKGFPAVITLLTCGGRQNGNDNYFQALQQIEGIDKTNFNATVSALIGEPTIIPPPPAAKVTSPKIIFFDDFNTGHLDRSKWNVEITGDHYNNELQAYVDSTKTLYEKDGQLVFQPTYAPGFVTKDGQKFDFISARINTRDKFDFEYGKAEARIRIDSGAGLWPAWWMLGYGDWPACGETDIMEFVGENDWASAAVHGPHYSGETPFVNRYYFPSGHDIRQWHTYAVDWTPDSLLFSYDGKTMFRLTRAMATHYGPWAFDKKEFLILNFALGGAYPAKVNGLTKPYYGLSQSTLDMIKQSKAKMYVDWVKVTQYP